MKILGEWTDGSPRNNLENTSRQNKNVILTDELGSLSNERGFELFSECFNNRNVQPIGKIIINNNKVIIFALKENGQSEIILIEENGSCKTIIEDNENIQLGFDKNYPIHGEYYINDKNEVVISWTDGNVTPKILNIDNPVNNNDKLELFNFSKTPIIIDSKIEEGGTLLTGAYFPIFRLRRKNDNTSSNWFSDYLPIYITDKSKSVGKDNYDGVESGKPSGKSISIKLIVEEDNYDFVDVGFIHQNQGVKIAYFYKSYDILNNTNTYNNEINDSTEIGNLVSIVISNITLENIDLSEIIIQNDFYKNVKLLFQDNDKLYLTDVEKYKEPDNIQQYINNVRLNWTSELLNLNEPEISDKFHEYNNHKKGFQHGEVYAIYIRLQWKWGWGKWYVCNGRLLEASDYVQKRFHAAYKWADTIEEIDYSGIIKTGHFGAWENENETYPLDGGFPIGKVRHFRFPTIHYMRKFVYNDFDYGTRNLDKLGIQVSNLNLNEIIDCNGESPISFELGYAKRNGYNNLVQGLSPLLLRHGFNYNEGLTTGGLQNERVQKIYPFELLKSKTSISTNYIRAELMLKTNVTKFTSDYKGDSGYRVYGAIDYHKGVGAQSSSIVAIDPLSTLILPANLSFIPNNVKKENEFNNLYLEEYVRINNNENFEDFINISDILGIDRGTIPSEETLLLTLLNIKNDLYDDFNTQEIISTGVVLNNNSNVVIYGGDCFICDYSFHTMRNLYGEYTMDIEELNKNHKLNGRIAARRFLIESQYNINLRNVITDTTEGYTQYYPKNGTSYMEDIERDKEVNLFSKGYNTDFNAILENYYEIYNGKNEEFHEPFKIIRSQEIVSNININNWRNFKQNDFIITVKNRGSIVNVTSTRDWIYVHFEKALYRTRSRNQYQVSESGEEIHIGSGNIFESELFPVIHSELGELGTQHKYSCYFSKHGYLFLDAEKGKWFLVNSKVIELSEKGMFNFFQENSDCIGDNPYFGNSVQSVWDDRFRRFIISRNYKEIFSDEKNNFKGVWKSDEKFINSLNSGDIVYYNGKYHRYKSNMTNIVTEILN